MEAIENTINTMAELAAESGVNAFGKDDPPTARIAYSFIFQLQYDNESESEFPQLTGVQFRRFRHEYSRCLINNGVRLDVAYKAATR
jgi:hypothetical protein